MKSIIILLPFALLLGCKVEEEFQCGTETVTYQGRDYNTVQIGDQCWLKENLNVGTKIPKNQIMTDNGIIEKYCYDLNEDSCLRYGGLYQWGEIMQYTTIQKAQGICPPGWHIPTDDEWKILEGTVDSLYGIGDSEWEYSSEYRGYNAGNTLKSTTGWQSIGQNGNGTDDFGFTALPGGMRAYNNPEYKDILSHGYWWTSSDFNSDNAWYRIILRINPQMGRFEGSKQYGLSVRCIKD